MMDEFSKNKEKEKNEKSKGPLVLFFLLNTIALIALLMGFILIVTPWKYPNINFGDSEIIVAILVGFALPLLIGFIPGIFTGGQSSENEGTNYAKVRMEFVTVFIVCLLTLCFFFFTNKQTIYLDVGSLALGFGLHIVSMIAFFRYVKKGYEENR